MRLLKPAPSTWTLFEAAHLLNRVGFGGDPEAIRRLHKLGRHGAVQSLLAPVESSVSEEPVWASDGSFQASAQKLREARRAAKKEGGENRRPPELREAQKKHQEYQRRCQDSLNYWWFQRMIDPQQAATEKMVLFWHDHFPVHFQKVRSPLALLEQNELFRQNAFGNAKELTHQVITGYAMVLYLDAHKSQKKQPNENLARELFELFTLGEGNYSEKDIRECARALTGYTINHREHRASFRKKRWDSGLKTIFDHTSAHHARSVIDLIFTRSEPSHLLAEKLWRYYVSEDLPKGGVGEIASLIRRHQYELRPVLKELFISKTFYHPKVLRNQIKSPIQYLAQLILQLEVEAPPPSFLLEAQKQLGQFLFAPPNVAGWDWGKSWINTNTLLARYRLAGELLLPGKKKLRAEKKEEMMMEMLPGMGADERPLMAPEMDSLMPREQRSQIELLVANLSFRFFQDPLSPKARSQFEDYARQKEGVIFTNREVSELIHLMLSTPEYQLT